MNDWDDDLQPSGKKASTSLSGGSWDAGLTFTALIAVAAVSFLEAYLTKDIATRPFWMLGICFAAPVAALMFSVFLKEKASSSMTPSTSRGAQLVLVLCSILAAAVVGCFCQVSNQEAKVRQEITHTGWNNMLIVMDKSGSMNSKVGSSGQTRDDLATDGVKKLIESMEGEPEVGLLLDVDWDNSSLASRYVPMAPLTDELKQSLIKNAETPVSPEGYGVADFKQTLEAVCGILEERNDPEGTLTILYVSDGEDYYEGDTSLEMKAADYSDRLKSLGATVNYIYVQEDFNNQMTKLAESTGGETFYATQSDELLDRMQQMSTVIEVEYVYKDALRDIQESSTAKIVTGILLLLLGVLIGVSLTLMLSVQGQKRFQLVLSPLMAAAAFLLLCFGNSLIPTAWIREAAAFTLFGVVLMRSNRGITGGRRAARSSAPASSIGSESSDSEW